MSQRILAIIPIIYLPLVQKWFFPSINHGRYVDMFNKHLLTAYYVLGTVLGRDEPDSVPL